MTVSLASEPADRQAVPASDANFAEALRELGRRMESLKRCSSASLSLDVAPRRDQPDGAAAAAVKSAVLRLVDPSALLEEQPESPA